MSRKRTIEEARKIFSDNSCELLETEYISAKTKMKYRCECGNISYCVIQSMLDKRRCRKCTSKKNGLKKRLTIEKVRKIFSDNDCELLETEYKNSDEKLKYRCKCGEIGYTYVYSMKMKNHCNKCGVMKMKKKINDKWDFDEIKRYYSENGCELLETEFINTKTKMRYICECGNIYSSNYYIFRTGARCPKCTSKKRGQSKKYKFEFVKKTFEEFGCQLLEDKYVDCKTKMKYKCICGDINYTNFDHVINRNSASCKKCGYKKYTGEKHFNYNPDLTDEDRERKRDTAENIKWRKEVYKKDNYTCQKCNQKGKYFNAHHKDGWHWCKEKRYEVSNGATLCEDCHKEFHKKYGIKNNTKEQYEEYLKNSSA